MPFVKEPTVPTTTATSVWKGTRTNGRKKAAQKIENALLRCHRSIEGTLNQHTIKVSRHHNH
jgi:hypothetical protein